MRPDDSVDGIGKKIVFLRGNRVMLSIHLAGLYGVEPKALIQAVKRNIGRFPSDFMFQLTWPEAQASRSQFVTLNADALGRGRNVKYLPYAFTQEGVAMLSSVLCSPEAVRVNIAILRAFMRLREIFLGHKELALKLNRLEKKVGHHDRRIRLIFQVIRRLMHEADKPKRRIGFHP